MKGFLKLIGMFALVLLPVLAGAQPQPPKPKRIYITLDVSGSMKGNKYNMANYAAQTLSVFSAPEDRLSVYYLGKRHGISGDNGYKQLQIPFKDHKGSSTYFEISDLTQFVKDYTPDPGYEDWLFIIGDGDWNWKKAESEYNATVRKLEDLFAREPLQVCYLQTADKLTKEYPFTLFLDSLHLPSIDIRKSDTTAVSVLSNCTYFANKILGFSNTGVQLQQKDPSTVQFHTAYPLERFLLVYQSGKRTGEVQLTSCSCDGASLRIREKGHPTTQPLVGPGQTALHGVVWEAAGIRTIPASSQVELLFNQEVDLSSLTLYPYVDLALGMQPSSLAAGPLVEDAPGHFLLCEKEGKVRISISARDRLGNKFSPELMQLMAVRLYVEDQEIVPVFCAADTTFRADVDVPGARLSYFCSAESPGYFHRLSPRQTLEKVRGVCPPDPVPMITLPSQEFAPVPFRALKAGEAFGGSIDDPLFAAVAGAGEFDDQAITDENRYPYSHRAGVSLNPDGTLSLTQTPDSRWCECAFPDTLHYTVTLRATNGILYDGKLYEGFTIPVTVPVDSRSWLERCRSYLFLAAGLLLLIIYLFLMLGKKRFGRNAMITPSYLNYRGKAIDLGGTPVRKAGFGAWFARWFLPGTERNTLSFSSPLVSALELQAAESADAILVSKASISPDTMKLGSYDPRRDKDKSKYLKLREKAKIDVYKPNGKEEGHLTFTHGEMKGGAGYRIFLVLLLLLSFAAEGLILFTLLKSTGLLL